jgi:hypothetical protein
MDYEGEVKEIRIKKLSQCTDGHMPRVRDKRDGNLQNMVTDCLYQGEKK